MTPAYFYTRVMHARNAMEHTIKSMLMGLCEDGGFTPEWDDTIQDTAARVLGHDTFTATMEMLGSIATWGRVMCSEPETIEEDYTEEDYTEEEYCDTCEEGEEDYELIYED